MRLIINNISEMEKKSAIYFSGRDHNFKLTYEILAIARNVQRQLVFLVLIENILCWIKNGDYLQLEGDIPKEWKFLSKYKYVTEDGIYKLTKIYAPLWMLEDKDFFGEIVFDYSKAKVKYFNNSL